MPARPDTKVAAAIAGLTPADKKTKDVDTGIYVSVTTARTC